MSSTADRITDGQISQFPIENRKASMDCLEGHNLGRDNTKWQKTLKVKIRARNYKRCQITSKEKRQKLFAVSVP